MEGLLAFSFIMRAAAKAILKDDDFFFSLIHDYCTGLSRQEGRIYGCRPPALSIGDLNF